MNRGLNLPQIQRIMHEFEKESATMDMKEEMMSDAVDDVMDDDLEDEEEEGDKILKQVLEEVGVDLSQQVCFHLLTPEDDMKSHGICFSSRMHQPALPSRLHSQKLGRPWQSVETRADHRTEATHLVEEAAAQACLMRMPCKHDWMPLDVANSDERYPFFRPTRIHCTHISLYTVLHTLSAAMVRASCSLSFHAIPDPLKNSSTSSSCTSDEQQRKGRDLRTY